MNHQSHASEAHEDGEYDARNAREFVGAGLLRNAVEDIERACTAQQTNSVEVT